MDGRPSEESARESLREHVVAKAVEARAARGGVVGQAEILALLEDRGVVRYPVHLRFDAGPLQAGEFACLQGCGEHPSDGFVLFVHPNFEHDVALLPLIVTYYIPTVNYGDVATHIEAELFGSTLLGIDRESYYKALCDAADSLLPQA